MALKGDLVFTMTRKSEAFMYEMTRSLFKECEVFSGTSADFISREIVNFFERISSFRLTFAVFHLARPFKKEDSFLSSEVFCLFHLL